MLEEPTHQRLISMRLRGMADAWTAQQNDPDADRLSFDERLGLNLPRFGGHRTCERIGVQRVQKEAKEVRA